MTAWRRCQSAGCGCAHHVNDVGLAVRLDTLRSQARCRCLDDAGRRRKRRFHPSSALTLRPTYNGRSRMWCAQRGDLQVLRRHHVRFAHQRAVSGKGRRPHNNPKHAGRSPLLCQNPYMFVVIGVEGGKGHKGGATPPLRSGARHSRGTAPGITARWRSHDPVPGAGAPPLTAPDSDLARSVWLVLSCPPLTLRSRCPIVQLALHLV